ncbi:MAG TPA: ABC transporter ATP-binding protein [Erysipelotrichaceae bacterium]|nr:ABC transporter ATP-binding protein [Erysipelotrichaceae bacterium]
MLFGRHINRYYIKYAFLFLVGIAALLAVDFIQLFIPEYLGEVVRILQNNGDTDRIITLGIYVLLVAAGLFLGRFLWRITLFNASHRIESEIRHEMFLKAEALPRQFYHENKVGSIMSWFTNDLETVAEYFSWGTIMLVDSLFLSVMTITKMINLDLVMSLLCLIPSVIIIILGAFAEKIVMSTWEDRQKAYDSLYDFAQENFTGIRVIKAFVKEMKEIQSFAKVAKKNADANISFARAYMIINVLIETIVALVFSMVLLFGGWFAWAFIRGEPVVIFGYEMSLEPDKLIEFIGYLDILIWPMIALGQIVTMYSRSKVSLKRINAFLDTEIVVKSPDNAYELKEIKGEITYKDFSFSFPSSSTPSLKNINLTINAGESIGVVGKIGCGKTTLVNVLLMIYNLEPGTLFIDGHDITTLDIHSLRNQIAYVPQDNFLFSDTIENNINFGLSNGTLETAVQGAKFAGVDEDIQGFSDGYQTVSGERGVTLSGGQKQRVSIARAYVKNSPILIMDDSVSAVDSKTEEAILHNIATERKGKTTLVVASRVSTVQHLDKIIVLNEGELDAFDTPQNLLKNSPTFQRMVKLQELEKEVEGVPEND